jgi:hypothetical protein
MDMTSVTVNAAIEILQRISKTARKGESVLCVSIHAPGSIGGTPVRLVTGMHQGIDWDSGKVMLTLDAAVTDLTPEQVKEITESVQKGQSWHAYQTYKKQREELASLQSELATARAERDAWSSAFREEYESTELGRYALDKLHNRVRCKMLANKTAKPVAALLKDQPK